MIIKVCGMRDSRNIQEVSALAVNWIGLIFYERSPRFIGQSPTKQWTVDSGQLTVKYRLSQLSTVNCQLIKWYDQEDHTHFDVCADDHCPALSRNHPVHLPKS